MIRSVDKCYFSHPYMSYSSKPTIYRDCYYSVITTLSIMGFQTTNHLQESSEDGDNNSQNRGYGGSQSWSTVAQITITLASVHNVVLGTLLVAKVTFAPHVATITLNASLCGVVNSFNVRFAFAAEGGYIILLLARFYEGTLKSW